MKMSYVSKAVEASIKAKQPVMIWGSYGVGKSQVVKQVCDKMKLNLIDLRLSLLDSVDLRGIPFRNEEYTDWAPPGKMLPHKHIHGERGVLFIDEINTAPPSVQAAAYQLILDRKLGEYEVPDGWAVIAAGNRMSDRSATHHMPAALSDRFVHIDAEVDFDDWVSWAVNNNIDNRILSFIRFRPALLNDPNPDNRSSPTPRSWEFISNFIDKIDPDIEFGMIAGTVGEGPAGELAGFLKTHARMQSPDWIIKNPTKASVPNDEPALMYAIIGALSERANDKNFSEYMQYIKRCPSEFQVIGVHDCIKRNEELTQTTEFNLWISENKDIIF